MLEDAFTFEKLLAAHKKCRLSRQHKKETISFEINLSQNLTEMSKKLLQQTYQIGKYKQFYIYEPKKRNIEALSYKDRVVLMAFCTNKLESKLEKKLIPDNVACRKCKGTMFGLDRLKLFLRKFYNINKNNVGYFLKCDLRKYFQNIDHDILKRQLLKVDFDDEDMWIINQIIDSRNFDTNVGLPIGNQTSQWFALFYLNGLDHFIKEKLRIKYYVRYMDDFILLSPDKGQLREWLEAIEIFLRDELRLKLNPKTTILAAKNGIDFVGYKHRGTHKKVRRDSIKRMKRKIKWYVKGKITKEKLQKSVRSWTGHASHADSYNLQKKILTLVARADEQAAAKAA